MPGGKVSGEAGRFAAARALTCAIDAFFPRCKISRTFRFLADPSLANLRNQSAIKTVAFIFSLLLLSIAPARAKIGATLEECFTLYGYPVQKPEPGGPVVFQKYGLFIIIEFYDRQACTLMVSKGAMAGQPGAMPLSDREVAAVMNANAFGRKWEKLAETGRGWLWTTTDGQIIAFRQKSDGSLMVWTREALARNKAEASAVEP